jgi:hypothetical protein
MHKQLGVSFDHSKDWVEKYCEKEKLKQNKTEINYLIHLK